MNAWHTRSDRSAHTSSTPTARPGRAPRRGTWCLLLSVTLLVAVVPALAMTQSVPGKHPLFSKPKPIGGDYDEWVLVGDTVRTFRVHLPPHYNHLVPLPLLLLLHDEGSDARGIEAVTHMSVEADRAEFIVAYPGGSGETPSWNAGHCCGAALAAKIDDVAFLEAIIDTMVANLKVDATRIGVAGLGNGGMLAYASLLKLSPKIAAAAVVGGSLGPGPDGGPLLSLPPAISPFSMLVLHAKDDAVVPFSGGPGGTPGVEHLAVRQTVAYFARLNRCAAALVRDADATEAATVESFPGCADATDIVLYTLAAGGHSWPSGPLPGGVSTAATILDFLVRHPKS